VHTVVEALKLSLADRDAFCGDSGTEPVPLDTLLSESYAETRRGLIEEQASLEFRPGSVDGVPGRMPSVTETSISSAASGAGEPTLDTQAPRRGDTCHIDVADRHGNLVACTPSGGWLQSSPAIPGLGFCLGTRGQMFWLEEGLHSSLEPGRRPRTTLSPTL